MNEYEALRQWRQGILPVVRRFSAAWPLSMEISAGRRRVETRLISQGIGRTRRCSAALLCKEATATLYCSSQAALCPGFPLQMG
jgi:hypothetical protein